MKCKTAVFLAAGSGARLWSGTKGIPKGFIKLGKRTIIEESIDKVLSIGVEEILIVTGFQDFFYEELKKKYRCIKTVKNEDFADSGTMCSLHCAKDFITGPFFLLESDLIYDSRALIELAQSPRESCLLISGTTHAGDEVYVEGTGGEVTGISKIPPNPLNVAGEFVGICKISVPTFEAMVRLFQYKMGETLHLDYDMDCLNALAGEGKIFYHKTENLLWAEIDNEEQFLRAKKIRNRILDQQDESV